MHAVLVLALCLTAARAHAQETTWRQKVEAWIGTTPPEPTTEEQKKAVKDLINAIKDRDIISNQALGAILDPAKYDRRQNLITLYTDNFDKYLDRVALIGALLSALSCPGQFDAVLAAANDPCVRFDFFIGVFKHERFHMQDHNKGTDKGKSTSQKECDAGEPEVKFYCDILNNSKKYKDVCSPLRIVMAEIKIERKIARDHQCEQAAEGK